MSQQEIKNGDGRQEAEAPGFSGSESGGEMPQNEWTARFDASKAAAQEPLQTEAKNGESEGEQSSSRQNQDIPLPKVDFSTFILSLASSALVQLGEVPNPETGKSEENLLLAKHTIDIISMLQEKTRNGMSAEESRLMEGVLYELRMKYVIKSR